MSPEQILTPKRMLTLLDRIERDAEEAERHARRLAEEYGWVYGLGLSPTVGERIYTVDKAGVPIGGTPKMGLGDPTGEVVADERKAAARDTARNLGVLIEEATGKARDAARILRAAKRLVDRRYGLPRGVPAPGAFPRTVTEAEVKESREAQQRRRSRGQGWGEG